MFGKYALSSIILKTNGGRSKHEEYPSGEVVGGAGLCPSAMLTFCANHELGVRARIGEWTVGIRDKW